MALDRTPPRQYTLSEEEEAPLNHEHVSLNPGGDNGSSHPRPQAVFNLDLDYSDDDALLDWEQYAGMNRVRCCGLDCSALARRLRAPQWWWTYPKRQRRCILGGAVCMATLLLLLIALAIAAATHGGSPLAGRGGGAGGSDSGGAAAAAPGTPPTAEEAELCSWGEFRLPDSVVPKQYNLTLDVPLKGPTEPTAVTGHVAIEVTATKPTRCVVLHGSDMEIGEVRLGGPEGQQGTVSWEEGSEQLILQFPRSLTPHTAEVVWLAFGYPLRGGLSGFYRSTYTAADGSAHSLATTQFEANAARTAFPCFDEPAFKAVFTLDVVAPKDLQVLSNSPPRAVHQHEHNEEHGARSWHFQPTPPMSTYLVAFIVGEFASTTRVVNAGPGGSLNVSVWGTPDRVGLLEYAADTAALVLPAYEAALGVEFPLPKMDLVAIPDFAAGAMENWGLVTYRETALLVSNASSLLDRRYVSLVVAHELAHQWFGSLVTTDFWGELWLNEGFASYFEFVGATAAHPEAEFFSTFYTSTQPRALFFDSKQSSHPLSVDPAQMNSTDVIESMFDAVSYDKGAAVLRMLRAWANRESRDMPLPTYETLPGATPDQDPFLLGLQQYLRRSQYNNTHASDLWSALSGPLGIETPLMMEAWTYRQGYPLVTLTVDKQGRVRLKQQPFALQGAGKCVAGSAWWIPISYTTSEEPAELRWAELDACQSKQPLLTLSPGGWVKLNAQQLGFYRVQYPADVWKALAVAARAGPSPGGAPPPLQGSDLAGLIEDAYTLAEAGEGGISHFLDLLLALEHRAPQDYEPWAAALPYIYKLERLLSCYTDWQRWVGDVLVHSFMQQPAYGAPAPDASGSQPLFAFEQEGARVPASNQTMGYRLLRPAILRAAGLFRDLAGGSGDVRTQALTLLTALEAPDDAPPGTPPPVNTLEADIRSAVYQAAARSDSWEVYHQLQEMYLVARDPAERERLLLALGYAPGAGRTNATLDFGLGKDVRAQDVRTLIVSTATNGGPAAAATTWDWLRVYTEALRDKLGGDDTASQRVAQAAEGVASLFSDRSRQAEVDAFFEQHESWQSFPGYAQRAKESIEANARWREAHDAQACAWVAKQRASAKGG